MGLLSKFFGAKKSTDGSDGNDPILEITIREENAPKEGINKYFIKSIRNSLISIESKYGPFAFVAIEQDQSNKNKYFLIISAGWVKNNEQSASIIGETVYNNLGSDLKPLLGEVKAVFLENVPQMVSGKERDLQTFADLPELRFNYNFEYSDTLCILAYNAQACKND